MPIVGGAFQGLTWLIQIGLVMTVRVGTCPADNKVVCSQGRGQFCRCWLITSPPKNEPVLGFNMPPCISCTSSPNAPSSVGSSSSCSSFRPVHDSSQSSWSLQLSDAGNITGSMCRMNPARPPWPCVGPPNCAGAGRNMFRLDQEELQRQNAQRAIPESCVNSQST